MDELKSSLEDAGLVGSFGQPLGSSTTTEECRWRCSDSCAPGCSQSCNSGGS